MYCIKCGVELADSEKVCPLCGTPVFHPDLPCGQGEPPYPPDHRPRVDEVKAWLTAENHVRPARRRHSISSAVSAR